MTFNENFWLANCSKSSSEIAAELGGDSAAWRKRIRKAKEVYPRLPWREDCRALQAIPNKVLKGICAYDWHHPHEDKKLRENIFRFTEDFEPDVWLFGGDNMDMDAISHWDISGHKRRTLEGKRLKKDYESFQREVLDRLDIILPKDCRKIWLEGNHEGWVPEYIDEHPEAEGFYEVENNLDLSDYETYRYGESAKVGKLYFIHGQYVNQHNACKTVQTYAKNVVYGHGHSYQAYTATTPLDGESHTAVEIPCGCGLNPSYMKNRPNSWLNGFGVFFVRPDGSFNLYPVIATNSTFVGPNGKLYE